MKTMRLIIMSLLVSSQVTLHIHAANEAYQSARRCVCKALTLGSTGALIVLMLADIRGREVQTAGGVLEGGFLGSALFLAGDTIFDSRWNFKRAQISAGAGFFTGLVAAYGFMCHRYYGDTRALVSSHYAVK